MSMTVSARPAQRQLRRSVPGWVLRIVLGGASIAAVAVVMWPANLDAAGAVAVLLVLLALGGMVAPGSVSPLLLILGVVAVRLSTPRIFDAALVVLVILVPLIHQLAGLAAAIPWRSACQWAALAPAARRYAMAVIPVCVATVVLVVTVGPAG